MNVGSVSRQEDPPPLVVIGESRIHTVRGAPANLANDDVVTPRPLRDHGSQARGGEIGIAFVWNPSLQLE